jgi:hypothetical protein
MAMREGGGARAQLREEVEASMDASGKAEVGTVLGRRRDKAWGRAAGAHASAGRGRGAGWNE